MSAEPETYTHTFDTALYKGKVTVNTGLFIGGKFVKPDEGSKIDVVNPVTGKLITPVYIGSASDVDRAVSAAQRAFKSTWGLQVPGKERGKLIAKLVGLMERDSDELAALESLNNGKPFMFAKMEVGIAADTFRYYSGWADKIQAETYEADELKLAYTRREPYGVVGQIIPWNFPLAMLSWKVAPALATGNTIVLKPSEVTPLTALKFALLVNEAGFPPGVVNIVNGYGNTVGEAISNHMHIKKVAFTGSTAVGRKIQASAAQSNLKTVTLELGGKSPNIIFDDADLEQAVKWATRGLFFNSGQVCTAGTRIFVQEGIYDTFLNAFTQAAKGWQQTAGDPFSQGMMHGPLSSQTQFDRVMTYISSGVSSGATVHTGGKKLGTEGYFVEPTIFTNATPDMKIVKEEIFGPVGVLIKFKTEDEVIEMANDTSYGLACAVFTENLGRAIRVAHALEAGTAWVNCYGAIDANLPFGGYKQSGQGRELGKYALDNYTQVKAVHVNIGQKI